MSNMNVTYAEMTSASARLLQGRDEMNSKLLELGNLIDSLVQNGFVTDHASVQYNETFDQFTAGTKQAIDALEGLAGFLDQAAAAMEDTDKGLASAIQG